MCFTPTSSPHPPHLHGSYKDNLQFKDVSDVKLLHGVVVKGVLTGP